MSESERTTRFADKRAVALKYTPDRDRAPIVVASGAGYMAQKITETALEAGVPVYEDDSLATLLGQLELGAAIPQELYQAIVDIYLYFLGFAPRENEQEKPREAEPARLQENGQESEQMKMETENSGTNQEGGAANDSSGGVHADAAADSTAGK